MIRLPPKSPLFPYTTLSRSGVDTVPPTPAMLRRLGRTEFVRADIRNPLIGKVVTAANVDTVVHMNISSTPAGSGGDRKSTRLNSSHANISYAVFCLKKKNIN